MKGSRVAEKRARRYMRDEAAFRAIRAQREMSIELGATRQANETAVVAYGLKR